VTGRVAAAAIAIAATAIVPASAGAAAKRGSIFDLTRAAGYERVTFTGDAQAGCAQFDVCGLSGSVTYRLGGTPRGALFLARSRSSGRVRGGASYRIAGTTRSTVTAPSPRPVCDDAIDHAADLFSAASLRSSPESVLLRYHAGAPDYLDTDCPGPTERDLRRAGALPEGAFPARGFRRRRLKFEMSGGQPFRARGFSAASEWDLKFRAKARECNPRCRIPAHRPR
jgi:hypothetical protein